MRFYCQYLFLFILLAGNISVCVAQTDKIKTTEASLQTEKADSNRAKMLIKIGKLFYLKSSYDSAIYYSNQCLNLSLKIDYPGGVASAYSNIGNIYSDKGNFPQALQNYLQALEIFEKRGPQKSIASIYNNIGIIYFNQGNYPDALKNYIASLKIKRESGDTLEIANTYNNIGEIYNSLGNYKEALSYYTMVMKIAESTKNLKQLGFSYCNLASVYKDQGNYMQAMENEKLALSIATTSGEKLLYCGVYTGFGDIFYQVGKYDSALVNYLLAIQKYKALGDKAGTGRLYESIGKTYYAKKEYALTGKYIDSALTISKAEGDKQNLRDIYALLVNIDSAQGKSTEAFNDYKMYMCYRDSLSNEESTRRMVSEQMDYVYEMKQAEEKARQGEKDSKQRLIRNVFIGGFGFAFLFAGIFFFQRRRISKERDRSDHLLLNILPAETADELKNTGESKARKYSLVTVMFTDFKNFTKSAESMTAEQLVSEINYCYKEFDKIIARHSVEKIKTMGDGYMAAGGVPIENTSNPEDTVAAALEIQEFMRMVKAKRERDNLPYFEVRIGIHSGPVIAGIVGLNKFAYDIWGVTVNLAARMESSGEAGKVNISGTTYDLIKNKFTCTYRGKIEAKNKGELEMYFVEA
jgi:adenylate cyclase